MAHESKELEKLEDLKSIYNKNKMVRNSANWACWFFRCLLLSGVSEVTQIIHKATGGSGGARVWVPALLNLNYYGLCVRLGLRLSKSAGNPGSFSVDGSGQVLPEPMWRTKSMQHSTLESQDREDAGVGLMSSGNLKT